jgi:homocysteine S-methyltransferase
MDGALGTELERRGFDARLPLWSAWAVLDAPHLIKEIHKDYLKAGARVLTAATFRTSKFSLNKAGLKGKAQELTQKAVDLAREAIVEAGVDANVIVAGSLAPLEDCYHPERTPGDPVLIPEHTHTALILKDAGVDCILVETQNSQREASIATAAAQLTGLPVWVSFMPKSGTELFNGDSLVDTAKLVATQGVHAVLVNCCPPTIAQEAFRTIRKALPMNMVGAYPNFGRPQPNSSKFEYELSPEAFAHWAVHLPLPQANIIGGCCGTTPEHIAALARVMQEEKKI